MTTFTFIHPTLEDRERVFRFMLACDIAEFGEEDSDPGDLADQWAEADLAADAWLALDPAGEIAGYALFSVTSELRCDLDMYVNARAAVTPSAELTGRAVERFRQVLAGGGVQPGCELVTYVNGLNTNRRAELEARGFYILKYHYRMQVDFNGLAPAPDLPAGFSLHTYTEDDKRPLYDLIVTAFDWGEGPFFTFEEWQKSVLRGGRFDPHYFILLRREGHLVGAALCYDEEVRGWLKELAVSKELRGMGLGVTLLKHIFHVFSAKGTPTVALGVVSNNPNAVAFYERAGMTRTREFIQFQLAA